MIFLNLEPFLQNFSFCFLFLTMLFFWIQASFFSELTNSLKPLSRGDLDYKNTNLNELKINRSEIVVSDQIKEKKVYTWIFSSLGTIGFVIANIALGLLLTFRWIKNGYFPLSNLYESLMFLSWSFTVLHLVLEKKAFTSIQTREKNSFIGVITAPMALFTNAFASFSLPTDMQKANSLVPALQSNWLMMHVTVMMLSYATLLIGCVLSIAFLVISYFKPKINKNKKPLMQNLSLDFALSNLKEKPNLNFSAQSNQHNNKVLQAKLGELKKEVTNNYPINSNFKNKTLKTLGDEVLISVRQFKQSFETEVGAIEAKTVFDSKSTSISSPYLGAGTSSCIEEDKNINVLNNYYSTLTENIDNLSYRILGVGFPLLTIGILSGAVWANEAWGSYWSWDPKETWAFITWLVFASYFHVRITKGWQGEKPAILASIGFLIIWVCYLGVNLLGKGLHSYGWISNN